MSTAGSIGSRPSWMKSLVRAGGIGVSWLGEGSTAADGREEGDLVARLERGRPGGKFAIARDGNGFAVRGKPGVKGHTVGEEVVDAGVRGNLDGLLTVTNGVLQSSKKEHCQANGVGVCVGHVGIVAPGRDCSQRSRCGGFEHRGPEEWNTLGER